MATMLTCKLSLIKNDKREGEVSFKIELENFNQLEQQFLKAIEDCVGMEADAVIMSIGYFKNPIIEQTTH